MFGESYIKKNLKSLNYKYNNAKTLSEPLYYSKLAIIELCGWIETTQDEIVTASVNRSVGAASNRIKIGELVTVNSGFHEKNFKKMLVQVIGYKGLEQVEAVCSASKLGALYRNINQLKSARDSLAHTYIKGQTLSIESPMNTMRRYSEIYSGFVEFDAKLKICGF